jgi:hypothetical protein
MVLNQSISSNLLQLLGPYEAAFDTRSICSNLRLLAYSPDIDHKRTDLELEMQYDVPSNDGLPVDPLDELYPDVKEPHGAIWYDLAAKRRGKVACPERAQLVVIL